MADPIEPPPIGPSGWALESAVSRSQRFPDSFLIPDEEQRRGIRVGQGVKLLFWILSETENAAVCERMWVLVQEVHSDGSYDGSLESTPETPGSLTQGAPVWFGPEHIAEIFAGQTGHEEAAP